MKRSIILLVIWLVCMLPTSQKSEAQLAILDIIREGITKVIVAVDLKIQRLQNKTIWLQNAQKSLENTLSKIHLDDISDWAAKQKELYADYFEELRNVKMILLYYQRTKDIIEQQTEIVKEYKTAWSLFRQDKNFTTQELKHMLNVFTGMMDEGAKSIDKLLLVINSFVTQMNDAKRLEIINEVAGDIEQILMDLRQFNEGYKMISLQRATEKNEIEYVKRLYGL
jgi:hypothetical protein